MSATDPLMQHQTDSPTALEVELVSVQQATTGTEHSRCWWALGFILTGNLEVFAAVTMMNVALPDARWIASQASKRVDMETEVIDMADHNLPAILGGNDVNAPVPTAAETLGKRLEPADAFIVVTPVYNRDYPGSLKKCDRLALPRVAIQASRVRVLRRNHRRPAIHRHPAKRVHRFPRGQPARRHHLPELREGL